ncbi:MAG: hypothetical protein JXK07_10325 [Spirochaetes bacterium]|nr:hypothetical protein [Spirochaetota bacterium]MBN2772319.1 hypothetical protein [Spirochaetota bacterium]
MDSVDYNKVVPERFRKRLNQQKNRIKLEARYDKHGRITQPFLYVVGLGEKHFRNFNREILRIEKMFPWLRSKHFRFVMNELIINSQFSMLREVVSNISKGKKAAGYFFVKIYPCDTFVSTSIEEFGDFFDYFSFISETGTTDERNIEAFADYKDEMHVTDLNSLSDNRVKIALSCDNSLQSPDQSNRIGLNIIENATDHDFYITSFYKNKKYMWKRIHFRIENN